MLFFFNLIWPFSLFVAPTTTTFIKCMNACGTKEEKKIINAHSESGLKRAEGWVRCAQMCESFKNLLSLAHCYQINESGVWIFEKKSLRVYIDDDHGHNENVPIAHKKSEWVVSCLLACPLAEWKCFMVYSITTKNRTLLVSCTHCVVFVCTYTFIHTIRTRRHTYTHYKFDACWLTVWLLWV